jgi:hypothetical protein
MKTFHQQWAEQLIVAKSASSCERGTTLKQLFMNRNGILIQFFASYMS